MLLILWIVRESSAFPRKRQVLCVKKRAKPRTPVAGGDSLVLKDNSRDIMFSIRPFGVDLALLVAEIWRL